MAQDVSTLPQARDAAMARRAARGRNLGLALLAVVVGLGLAGALGPRTATVTAQATDGTRLEVVYPSATRSGLPAPLRIRVTREGGFDTPITVRLDDDLFDRLDFQSWYPSPASETGGPLAVEYEFDPPPGETLEVSLDARTAPGQWPSFHRYRAAVVEDGAVTTEVMFRVTVMP